MREHGPVVSRKYPKQVRLDLLRCGVAGPAKPLSQALYVCIDHHAFG
jgi:hypothetical protein